MFVQELSAAQKEQDAIKQKLAALERKIIVGGENLLDKVRVEEIDSWIDSEIG